ncbi:MAG: DUF1501 domain-containing protein [Planctomycetota bacterium]|nr:DUF1501 domain-containing protein [Planctomycetota bacterium]
MIHRRSFLHSTACGFGSLATASLLSQWSNRSDGATSQFAGANGLHFPAKAKRVIFLFMQGGVSQVDSFDYKPLLASRDGEMVGFDDAREFANKGTVGSQQRVMKSPWGFNQYGQSGRWVSDLFPNMAEHVDRMAMVHSMHTDGVAHGPATLFLHSGSQNFIRPSMGSWIQYGIGSENENLPGFVSISPSIGNGGARNYGSAFLPARFQGTPIGKAGNDALTIDHLQSIGLSSGDSNRSRLDQIQALNQIQLEQRASGDSELEAAVQSYEMAWRMQNAAPELLDFSTETEDTIKLYGLDQKETQAYGRKCLLARRLCESGVRFVQVNYGDNSANPAWDQHSNLPKHAEHARAVDQPIAGLLTDLAQRGLLEDTLVWWGGEFGRAPYAEKNGTGRDHNPGGFTMWLSGGGVQPGVAYGRTDEFGHLAIENKVHMHDMHATILHLLGIDHEKLTFKHAGRDFRLTDVHGRVVRGILS